MKRNDAPSPSLAHHPRYGLSQSVLGLPARAVAITNSERTQAFCDLRWYYGHGLGLGSGAGARASFGLSGHDALEDIYRWWMVHDTEYPAAGLDACLWCAVSTTMDPCPMCGGTTMGPLPRIAKKWAEGGFVEDEGRGSERETPERRLERLRRVLVDYLHVHGHGPPNGLQIVGVEVPVACPIPSPEGTGPYCPKTPLVKGSNGGWRFARVTDDPATVRTVQWPWYALGRLDALAVDRGTRHGVVIEHKFTMDPRGYLDALTNDTQTPGYVTMADHVARNGGLVFQGIDRVTGFLYDVASSSFHYDPVALKGGGFSKAQSPSVPSWRYLAGLQAAGVDPTPYMGHIDELRSRLDPRLYMRERGHVGGFESQRWLREMGAVATRIAAHRRALVSLAGVPSGPERDEALADLFPRSPVCKAPGVGCSHRGICASGSAGSAGSPVRDGTIWSSDPSVFTAAPVVTEPVGSDDLPF